MRFLFHTSRMRYWSCSAFADWLRGTAKPGAATIPDWDDWKVAAKTKNKFRFWLAEEGLDTIQNILHFPLDLVHEVKYRIRMRFFLKPFALFSDSLNRYSWTDLDSRILYCLFDELVKFVEIEMAWMYLTWDKEARERFNIGKFKGFWRVGRVPLAGLAYLQRYMDGPEEEWGNPASYKEIFELYTWWKQRDSRPDPFEASGWAELADAPSFGLFGLWRDVSDEGREKRDKVMNELTRIEDEYEAEDEAMLIRLIKIRKHLWT